jgi:hypothetical protein
MESVTDIALEQVQLDALDALWPHFEPHLSEACDAVLTTWTPAGIKAAVEGGELALIAIYDRRQPLPVLGALTLGYKQIKDETVVSFVHLGGREMHRWLDQMVGEVEALAKSQGATRSEIEGRPGWERATRHLGYRAARVVLHKVL